ncbi:MAG: AraC family transcriptional regulator [Cyclobacteriaceae bacterium]
MKVLPFKIPRGNGELLMLQHDKQSYIYHTLHQHPEMQLMLIRKSTGTAVVGGHIGAFQPGDVFLIGSNVAHAFRNDDLYYREDPQVYADVVYVFIDASIPHTPLLNFLVLNDLFVSAKRGIKLSGGLREQMAHKIDGLLHLEGLDRLIGVLEILNAISKSQDFEYLNRDQIIQSIDENDGTRLNSVIEFTFENYENKITLEEISGIANMVPSAFCRFFKQRTRKTYFDFLNEIRIRHASRLLLEKDFSILEICLRSGFNNLSYFNRKFKAITGYSPLKYHKAIKGTATDIRI